MNQTKSARRGVLAVVVTYRPDADLPRNLIAIREQVQSLVVVDNGSENLEFVRASAASAGCRLISNVTNLGVAAALNQALRLADDENFEWLATFDQDSLVAPRTVSGLLAVYEDHPEKAKISVIALAQRQKNSGDVYYFSDDILASADEWRSIKTTITSGSFIKLEIIEITGAFSEKLFIDFVDHEFCLRCRRKGFLIVEATHFVMTHSLGTSSKRKFLWWNVTVTNHSATRRYYMVRNQLDVYFHNFLFDPKWSSRGFGHLVVSCLMMALFEANKADKFVAILEGLRDFAFRRFGARDARLAPERVGARISR